ncbi:MAG: T9SS type A sorting domain-containing protein [Bacteroidetes bacterium]|nr:T9SS type A sorting domain-containing protein [Bacteroidota bacterium]
MMKRTGISLLVALLLLVGLGSRGNAQSLGGGLNADGRDFYIGLLYPSFNAQSINFFGRNVQGFFGVYALISSYDDNTITVGYFDDNGNEINKQTYNVAKRRAVQVPLDIAHMRMTEPGEVAEYKACHITAKKSINVQFFSTGSCSGGSYLAIPTNVLGKTYVVQSYRDNEGGVGGALSNEDASGYFMVIAPFSGTTVTITPSSTTKKKHAGVNCGSGATGVPAPFTIGLNQGQCYMVKGAADGSGCDISNSTVIADKPVAVIAGHENAFTDGSDPQPGGARTLEARDYMVEQMLPVEYWDTMGYISIPFVDSQAPFNAGEGDEYQVFTGVMKELGGVGGSNINMNGTLRTYNGIGEYQVPPPQLLNWTSPVDFYSTNGTKIGVAMYDQRMQGGGAPYPAPSQMTIIPKSRWKTSFLWYVPNNTFEILQGYYINLICNRSDYDNRKILIAVNGGKPAPLPNGLAVKKKYAVIPDYPELVGYSLSLGPGAYYATADTGNTHPFMIYNYGFRAIDPDRDLGDFCGDDHFFAYALPVGFAAKGDSGQLEITVDTLCAKWHICIHDHRTKNPGIKSLQILDDASGDFVRPGRVYHNVQFDESVDPDQTREIDLTGTDTLYCADVLVSNPLDTAYGPIYILDNQGNDYLVELRYKAPSLKLVVKPNYPNQKDSVIYPATVPGATDCATIYYYNGGKKGDNTLEIDKAELKRNDGNFTISSITPALPVTLAPGDTLAVTVCFSPQDKNVKIDSLPLHLDSLIITTPCFKAPMTLVGPVGVPLIWASNKNFGSVVVGTTKCDTVTVRNVGNVPFTLTDSIIDATLLGNHDFTWDGSSKYNKNRLPVILQPGQGIPISFCFTPSVKGFDSTNAHWITDVQGKYKDSLKSYSGLYGNGIRPGVVWDRIVQYDTTICDSALTIRVNLINTATAPTHVQKVFFDGADAPQYAVVDNKFHYSPLEGFTMNVGDTLWVDYKFTPDLSKGFAPRHSHLVATFDAPGGITDSTVIDMTGIVEYPALLIDPPCVDLKTNIVVGVPTPTNFLLTDTGTAPYIFSAVDFSAPIVSIVDVTTGVALQPGDTIMPGQQVAVTVTITRKTYGDTTVYMNFASNKSCGNTPQLCIGSNPSQTSLLLTGWPAPDTYINCRDHKSTILARNLSTVGWTLKSLTLEPAGTTTGLNQFDLIDSNNNYQKQIVFNKFVPGSGTNQNTVTVGVVFHPDLQGSDSVRVMAIWDSAGVTKDTVFSVLSGTGIAEVTAVSAANPDPNAPIPGWYVYTTGETSSIPLHFETKALPASASAKRVTFDVTWKQDVFDAPATGAFVPNRPTYDGTYTLNAATPSQATGASIDVSISNGVITSLDEVGRLNLAVPVNKDTTTQILISNVKFYDDLGNIICYIAADTIPGNFVSKDVCGNLELRDFLRSDGKQVSTRIISLTPNPVTENSTPVLNYEVREAGVPVKVEVFNMLGEVVRTVRESAPQTVGTHALQINTTGLESGTYNVRISTPTSTQNAQFVLHK